MRETVRARALAEIMAYTKAHDGVRPSSGELGEREWKELAGGFHLVPERVGDAIAVFVAGVPIFCGDVDHLILWHSARI